MNLIERLRRRWRHTDPEVRAEAVREIGAEDQDLLASVAAEDDNPRVRRLALKKLDDPELLGRLAQSDADPSLRELAAERAREVLVATATSPANAAECEAALARLSDERSLAVVAASAHHDTVRRAALTRTTGDRALRDVVRTATDASIRLDALARIADAGVLRSIAVADGPPEVALRAVEAIADAEALRAIVDHRTAAKAVRQRARAILEERGESLGDRDARARQLALATAVQQLSTSRDVTEAAERVRAAQEEWDALAREAPPREDVAANFVKACRAILDEAASRARRGAEADRIRSEQEDQVAARRSLCARVEGLHGPEALRELEAARAAWNRLAPMADDLGLGARFAAACEAAVVRLREQATHETVCERLGALVAEAETLSGGDAVPKMKAWDALAKRWDAANPTGPADDEIILLRHRFTTAGERVQERAQESEQQREEARRQNLARLESLCGRLETQAKAETIKLTTARRDLRNADASLGDMGPLPPTEQRSAWIKRLTAARDELLKRVRDLEETEEWRRWANVAAQEEIIGRVEGLLESNDLAEGIRALGRLQEEWAAVASAPQDKAQALWERFKTARSELHKRCDAFMAENLEKKRALVAQVKDLGESASWNETTDLIRRLQAEWKELGPVPVRYSQAIWREFREPCDRFFERRKRHFAGRDAQRQVVVDRKTVLCEQAEKLSDSKDWDTTTNAMKQLQAKWKESGPLPRAQSDALWNRFRAACDRFFDRRNRRDELEHEETLEKGAAICDQLEQLVASLSGEEPPADDAVQAAIDEAWASWTKLELTVLDGAEPLNARLGAAFEQIAATRPDALRGTKVDPETTRMRREKLCARLEELAGAAAQAPKQLTMQEMALALRDRLASNTIAGAGAGTKKHEVAREASKIQTSWAHLGPIVGEEARGLAERFARARERAAGRAE